MAYPPRSRSELQAQFERDFLTVDGLEPVTWKRFNDDGSEALTIAIPYALRRAGKKEIQWEKRTRTVPDIHLIPYIAEVVWHVPAGVFAEGNINPRKGDAIVDSSDKIWIVWLVEIMTMETRYRLTCHREN